MRKEFKGTKGEWFIRKYTVGEFIKMSITTSCGHVIALLNKENEPVNDEIISMYDAQLIAAAPDMLEALMIINDNIERGPVRYSYQEKMEIVKKAINKALGL